MSRNRRGQRDSKHYFEWMEFASEDLAAAAVLTDDETCLKAAGFHCQQTIEKSVKSYLLFVSGRNFDGHNLSWLVRQASKFNPEFIRFMAHTTKLNRYYIECRYPSDNPQEPDIEQLRRDLEITREIYEYICSLIYDEDYNADYDDENEPD